jgi:hypothetical protein
MNELYTYAAYGLAPLSDYQISENTFRKRMLNNIIEHSHACFLSSLSIIKIIF